MGGVGKTTLSKEIFNRKRSDYSRSCFLFDVREASVICTLPSSQKKLLRELFDEKCPDQEFTTLEDGKSLLSSHIQKSHEPSFLIVLDDIDSQEQLDALLISNMLDKFLNSLVIVTTRDVGMLINAGISVGYHLKGMETDDAKELFGWHAFRQPYPSRGWEGLVDLFVQVCGGLPLSLQVLGSHVHGTDQGFWQLELEKVKKTLPPEILKRLRISIDTLDNEEKQIFIDIACFFIGESTADALSVWEASGWSSQHALRRLENKCLVEGIEDSGAEYPLYHSNYDWEEHRIVLRMHDHLRDLGRQMADELRHPRRPWRSQYLQPLMISVSESEDRDEEENREIFSMTEEEEKGAESEKQEKQDSESSFFALIAPVNKELKVGSSKWEPCKPYVHPAKRKSTLSDKSLRLCTESLGCESGTDCSYPSSSDTDDCSSASSEDNSSVFGEEEVEEESKFVENLKISDNVSGSEEEKEIKSRRSFPPPLSSIARSDGPCIHMRSYKQDGRLLLKAVQVESSQKYLRARREDGRLQLHLFSTQRLQELSPEEEKIPAAEHDQFSAQNSKAEENRLKQQHQQFKSSSAFSSLSNLRRHVLRSEYQNPSKNKEFPLNLDMNSTAKAKVSLLLKNTQSVQGSNLGCSKEKNSFSKGFEDLVQERPSQSLVTSPGLLYYQPFKHSSPASGDFESKSLPKFPCNESFRRLQVRHWLTTLGEPRCIAIS